MIVSIRVRPVADVPHRRPSRSGARRAAAVELAGSASGRTGRL